MLKARSDFKLACLPNRGADCVCSHIQDSDSLLVTRSFGLPSHSNQLSPALYSCYLMKLLYNIIFLSSDAHSNVRNQHCRALPVLCRALIVLLVLISGIVNVHPGPSTSPNSYLCSDICFTDVCSLQSLGFLHINTRSLLPKFDKLKV